MKIGVLTLPLYANYGGILQAYALYSVLTSMGHDVSLIDGKMYEITTLREKVSVLVWQAMHCIGLRKTIHPQLIVRKEMEQVIPFIEKHIPRQIALQDVKKDSFDAIIVGSDQVWRGTYSPLLPYFLDFTQGWKVRRIAYAASFGADDWYPKADLLDKCRQLIKGFTYVSVRELSGQLICNTLLNRHADWVLDPTMLKTAQQYRKSFIHECRYETPYLLSYILDQNEEKKMMIAETINSGGATTEIKEICLSTEGHQSISVESWLQAIYDAQYIVTDSFHGAVFSLIFNKPFSVIINNDRGSARFQSLLGMVHLENRIVTNSQELLSSITEPIDWKSVNEEIERKRNYCMEVLKNILQ